MRAHIFGFVCLLGVAAPVVARAQVPCSARYANAFAGVRSLGLRGYTQNQANIEVLALFGPRPDACEAGAYPRFLESFREFAREAMRAPVRQRDGMLRVAIAVCGQGPARVPFEEGKAAVTLFRQARSDLHATADDVGLEKVPMLQQLLDALDRAGPPQSLPPPAAPPPPKDAAQVQAVRPPTTPLPPWAVISLYEVREALNQKNLGVAQGKLEAVLKWMETAP